jgi:hypothetical protein
VAGGAVRVQIRAVVRTAINPPDPSVTSPVMPGSVCSFFPTVEIFDKDSGKTLLVLMEGRSIILNTPMKLINPDSATTRQWLSFNGTIRPTEIHNIAFDPLSHVLLSGNQDTGTSYQLASGGLTWTDIAQGDGANVGVDADQTAHSGVSYRYESYIKMQSFHRHSFGSNNLETTSTNVLLNIVSGTGSGKTLTAFDTTAQFNNPWVLNNLNPASMLIGTSYIYESTDKGDSLANLALTGGVVSALSYGSRLSGTDFPGAFYVGAGTSIYHRVSSGNTPTIITGYKGSNVVNLLMDPQNYQHIYVIDDTAHVWASFDEGVTFEELTGDLANKVTQPHAIEMFSPPPTKNDKKDDVVQLIVGGIGDVVSLHPRLHEKQWTSVASGLPHAFFYDVHYNDACDMVVAGALGRGAWTTTGPFKGGSSATCPPVVPSGAAGVQGTGSSAGSAHPPIAKGKDK